MSYLSQRPVKEFRALGGGTVTASVWRNESEKDGQILVSYSIRVQKRYFDRGTNTWNDSDYYFPEDLPKLRLVIEKAYEYTRLRERDPRAMEPVEAGTPADADFEAGTSAEGT
jgi:hypothetical protein